MNNFGKNGFFLLLSVIICQTPACKPSMTTVHDKSEVAFSGNQEFAVVRSYEICCGSIKGFLLDSATEKAVDIWVDNIFGEFFLPLRIPTHGINYSDVSRNCRSEIYFDQNNKSLYFRLSRNQRLHLQFSRALRDVVYAVLRSDEKEEVILLLEVAGTSRSKSKAYLISDFKKIVECEKKSLES